VNAGHSRRALATEKPGFAGMFAWIGKSHVLLAMQKVEGSNPFSRF
jgi:hypothetical protein